MGKVNYILTGASALFHLGFITFNPSYISVEMEYGTKVDNYNNKYKISTQAKDTLEIGVITEPNGQRVYKPERLYIELNKFPLESTIKTQAINNLENAINPEIVKRYYDQLKNKRRNLDKLQIEKFLEKNLMNIKEVFESNKFDQNQIIREYLMALLSRKNIPLCIIKGGSAVELFINDKRATQDLDIHNEKSDIVSLLEYLQDRNKVIYFKFDNIDDFLEKLNKENGNPIRKIFGNPKTNLRITDFNLTKPIELTFNTTYDRKELHQFITDFSIQKRNLKIFKNASAMVFTREMLIAEKYQSLISKPEESARTKDLIDLGNLFDDDLDLNKVYDWLLIKWSKARKPQNQKDVQKIIIENKDKELVKIKENFNDATEMYNIKLSFDDCMNIYHKISDFIITKITQ